MARYHAENTAITDYRLNYKQFYLFLLYEGVILRFIFYHNIKCRKKNSIGVTKKGEKVLNLS